MIDSLAPMPRLFPLFRLVFGLAAACFIAALAADVVYLDTPDMQWSNFAVWLIAGGLIVALVAALVGIGELVVTRLPHGWFRSAGALPIGAALVSIVEVFNIFVHSRDAYQSVYPTGVTLSVVAVVLLLLIPLTERMVRKDIR